MATNWVRFGGLAAASGSALCLNRLLEFSPLRSESAQDSRNAVHKSSPQHWRSLNHSTIGMIKRRKYGESGALHLLSGSAYPEIATEVSNLLGVNLTQCKLGTFADGECSVEIMDPVSSGDIFIISPTHTNNSLIELLLMVSAVRRVGVKRITAVIPYFGYSRQDVRTKRGPVAASDVANMLQSVGIDRMISVDMHSAEIEGFFCPEISVEHLSTAQLAADYYSNFFFFFSQKLKGEQDEGGKATSSNKRIVVVASQDGHVTRATNFANCLESLMGGACSIGVALVSRSIDYSDEKKLYRTVVGDVKGADCIIIDDIIATGETLEGAVKAINAAGAASVSAFATHGRFCKEGEDVVNSISGFEELVICDTVPQQKKNKSEENRSNVVNVLSVAPLLAEAIFSDESDPEFETSSE